MRLFPYFSLSQEMVGWSNHFGIYGTKKAQDYFQSVKEKIKVQNWPEITCKRKLGQVYENCHVKNGSGNKWSSV